MNYRVLDWMEQKKNMSRKTSDVNKVYILANSDMSVLISYFVNLP